MSFSITDRSVAPVRVLRCSAEVVDAAPGWDQLASGSPLVGGSAWVGAWLETYGTGYELAVVESGEPGAPGAVLPLVRRRGRPRMLELLGVRELAEPTDVRTSDPAALEAAVHTLASLRTPLMLRRLPADSPLLPGLTAAFGRRGMLHVRPLPGTPTLTLAEGWRDAPSQLSSRRRGDLRAAERRAAAQGELQFAVETPSGAEAGPLFDELVSVESAGWKMRAGTALAAQPRMLAFFRRFVTLAAEQGILRLAFLRIDGRAVAVQLAVEADGGYGLFKIGYDEEFARCSPGNLLLLHTIQWAARRGLTSYEFLGAREPWTDVWTKAIRPCLQVQVFPLSPWSPVAAVDLGAAMAVRRLRARSRRAPVAVE